MAYLLVALTSAILAIDANALNQYRFWIVGSVAGRELSVLVGTLPFLGLGFLLAFASGRSLNALALGEDVARSLGQRVRINAGRHGRRLHPADRRGGGRRGADHPGRADRARTPPVP